MRKDITTLVPWETGEIIEIRRTVGGKTASYVVAVADASSIGERGLRVTGGLKGAGYSSYVDGRIDRQAQYIAALVRKNATALDLLRAAVDMLGVTPPGDGDLERWLNKVDEFSKLPEEETA